ncbi:hypothetical protein [Neorhizobium sp. SOG26]|nr:hypothetical protein [Neorhizobium sp. SOG26]
MPRAARRRQSACIINHGQQIFPGDAEGILDVGVRASFAQVCFGVEY